MRRFTGGAIEGRKHGLAPGPKLRVFFKFNFVFSGVCQNLEVSHRFSCNHRGQDDSLDWVRGQFESSNQKGNYEHNQIEMSHKTNLICLMTYNWFYVTYIVFWVFFVFFCFFTVPQLSLF